MNAREQARAAKLHRAAEALREANRRHDRNRKARAAGRQDFPFSEDEEKTLAQHARLLARWGTSAERTLCLPYLPADERTRLVGAVRRAARAARGMKPPLTGRAAQIEALAEEISTALRFKLVAAMTHTLSDDAVLHADDEGKEMLHHRMVDRLRDHMTDMAKTTVAVVVLHMRGD